MSLTGARLRYLDENGQEVSVPAKGRTLQIGSSFSCDVILDPQAERLICEIKCDAFGRVTIHNQSNKETAIQLNEKVIHGQRGHPLLHGNRITILDRVYTWECHKMSGSEDVPSTPERLSPVEQAPNSCPSLKSHRPQIDKRLTVHNFRYSINSDDEGNTSIESRGHNESHLEEEESLNYSTPPSTEIPACETPKVDLVEATQNKENTATPAASQQQLLQLCALSDVVITSFSPRETGVKVEKSFTCIRKPTKMGKQFAASVTMSTPKSVYSTPKGGVLSELNDDSCSRELVDFSTPSTSKKTKRESSMYLIDLTTPSKLRPSFKQQLPTPISVDSTDESSDGSPFVIDITKSETPPTPTRSQLPKTPRRPAGAGAAATPNRTPQSLMKRALLTSTKKKQIVDRTPVTTPKRLPLNEARRQCRTLPRLPFPSVPTVDQLDEQRAAHKQRGQAPNTTPRKRQSLHLGTPRDNKLSQIRKSLAAAKRSPTVDLGNRLKAKARRTLNSPKSGSPKAGSPKPASPAPRKTINLSLAKCSTPEKLDDSAKDELSRTFTIMDESGNLAEERSVLGMMAALVTGETDSSVVSRILETSPERTETKEHKLAKDQAPENTETELHSAMEKDAQLDENGTKSLKEAGKELGHPVDKVYQLDLKENTENSSIQANENVIIEDSICEEIHANIPKPIDDDDIRSADPVGEEEIKEPSSRVETPMIRRSLRRLSVDQRAGVATTPRRRSSTRRASVEPSSSSKAEMKTENSKMGSRRASCSALDSQEVGTPRRKRRFTDETGTPTRQSKRLLAHTPKRALQVDDSIGDMGVIVEEAAGQEDDDEPRAIVDDENYGKELPSDEPDNVNYQGLRDLLKTPKNCSTPRFKGLREMMRTPKVPVSPIFGNIEELLDNSTIGSTPHRNKASRSITVARVAVGEGKALDGVLKTPSARNIMVPIEPPSAILKSRGDSLAATTEYDLDMTNTTLHLDQIFDDVPSTSVTNMEDTEAEINVTALSTASGLDPLRESVSSEAPMSVVKPAATDVASHKNDPLTSTTYKAALQTDLELSTFTEQVEASSRPSSPDSNEMSGIQLLDQTSDSMFSEPLMVSGAESCKDFTVDETRASGRTTCPPIEVNEVDTDSNIGLTEPLVFSDDDDETEVLGDAGRTPKKSKAFNNVSIAYKLDESSTSKVNKTSSMDKSRENDSLVEEVSMIEVDESVPDDSINATNDGKSLVIELDSSSDTEAPPAKENNESAAVELTIVESETFPLDSTEDLEVLSTSVDQKPVESVLSVSEDANKITNEVLTKPSDPEIEETLPSQEGDAEKSSTTDVASTDNGNDNEASSAQDPETFPLDSTADSSIIVEEEVSSKDDQKPIDTKEDSASKPAIEEDLSEEKTTGDDGKETDVSAVVESQTFPLDSTADSSVTVEEKLSSNSDQKPIDTKEDSAGKHPMEDQPVIPSAELSEEKTTGDDEKENDASSAVDLETFSLDSTADSSVTVEEELSSKADQKPIDSITKDDSAGKPAGEEYAEDALPSEELAEQNNTADNETENEVSSVVFSEIFPLDSTADSSDDLEEEMSSKADQKPINSQLPEKPALEDQAVPSEKLAEDKLPVDATTPDAVTEESVESLGQNVEPNRIITKPEVSLTSEVSLGETEESKKGDDGLDTEAEPSTSEVSLVEAEKAKKGDNENDDTAGESRCPKDEPNQNESISTDMKPAVEVSVPIDSKSEMEPSTLEVTSVGAEEAEEGDLEKDDTSQEHKSEAEQSTSEESLVKGKVPEEGDVEEMVTCVTANPDEIVTEKPTTNTQDVEVVPSAEESALKAQASPSPSPATIQGDDIALETSAAQDFANPETVSNDLGQEVPPESSIQENYTKEDATETKIMQDKKPCGDQQTNGDEAEILAKEETSKPNEEHKTQVESVSEAESNKEEPTIDQLSMNESAPVTAVEKSPLKDVVPTEESKETDIIAGDQQERDTPALEDSVVTVVLDDDSTSMETTQNEGCGQEPASPNVVPPTDDKPGEPTPMDTCSIIEDSFTEQPKKDFSDSIGDIKEREENQVESEDEVIQLDASSIVIDSGEDSVIEETPKTKFFANDPEVAAINEDLTDQEVQSITTEEASVVSIDTLAKEFLEEETGQNNPPMTAEVSLTHNLDAAQDDSLTQQPEEVTTAKTLQEEPFTDMMETSATVEASSSTSAVQEISAAESPKISATEAPKTDDSEISHIDKAREVSATEEPLTCEPATSNDLSEILSAHESSRESAKENPQKEESTSTAEESEDKSQDQTEVQQSEEAAQVVPLASPKAKVVEFDKKETDNDVPKALTETKHLSIEEEAKDTVQNQSVTEVMSEEETEKAQASESITNKGEQPQLDDHHMKTSVVEDSNVIELSDDSESGSPLPQVEAIPVEEEDHITSTVPASEADTSVPVIETPTTKDSKEGKVEDVPEDLSDELQEVAASDPITNQEAEHAEKPQTSEKLASEEIEADKPTLIAESVACFKQYEKARDMPLLESPGQESSGVKLVSEHLHDLEVSKETSNAEVFEAFTKEASTPKDVEVSKSEDTQNEKLAAPNAVNLESETSEILKKSNPEHSVSPKHSTMKASRSARKPLPHDDEPSDKNKEELKPVKRATRKGSASVESPVENVPEKPSRRVRKPSADVDEMKSEDIREKPKRRAAARKPSAEVEAEPMLHIQETKEEDVLKVIPEEEPHSSRPNQTNELQKEADTHQKPEEDVQEKPRRRARKPSEEVGSVEITEKPKKRARKPAAEVAETMVPLRNEKEADEEPKEEDEAHSSKISKDNLVQKEAETHQKQEEKVLKKPIHRGRNPSAEPKDEIPKTSTDKEKRRGHKLPEEHVEKEKEIIEEPNEQIEGEEPKKSDETKQEEIIKSHTERPKRRGRKASAEETETTSGKKPKIDELIPEEDAPKPNTDEQPQESQQPEKPKGRGRMASAEEDASTVAKKPTSEEVLQSIVEEGNESKAISTANKEPEDVPAEGRSKRRGRKPSKEEVVVEPATAASQPTDSANGNAETPLASIPEDQTTNLTEQNGPKKRNRKSSEFVPAAEVDEATKEAEHIERPKRRGRKPSVDIEHVAPDVPDKPRRRGRTPVEPEKQPLEEEPDKKTRRKPSADTVDALAHNTEVEHLKDIEEVAEPETEPEAATATSKQLPEAEEEPKTRRRGRKPVPAKKDTPEEGLSRRRGRKATEDEAPVEAKTSLEEEQPNEVPADSNNEVQELPADVEAVTQVPTTEKKSTRRVRKASANVDEGTTAVAKKTTTRRGRKEDALVDEDDVQEKQIDLQQVPTESETAALVMSASTTKIADQASGASEDELTPRRREGRNMPRKNYDETSDEDKQRSARRARKPAASRLLTLKAPEEEATPPPKRQPVEEVGTPTNMVHMPEPTTSQRREGRNVPRKNYTEAPDDDKPSTSRSRRMRNLTAKALELIVDSTPRPNTPRGRKAKAGGDDETPAKKAFPEAAPLPPTDAESGADEEPAPAPVIAKGRGARRKADDDLAESGAAPPPSKRGARGQHEESEDQPEAAKPAKKNVRATARKAKAEIEPESEPAVPAKKARGGGRAKTPVKPPEEKCATEPEEHPPPSMRKGRLGTRAKTPVVVEDSATELEEEPAKKPAARSRARGAKAAAVPEPEPPAAMDSDVEASLTTASRGGRAKKVHFEPTQIAAATVDSSAENAPKRATRSRRK